MIRQPVVAGSFYPEGPSALAKQLDKLVRSEQPPQPAKAIIAPHAGYVFSGAVAGELMAATQIPPTVLLLGPNHHGVGSNIAISAAESWSTPVGDVPIVDSIRQQLCLENTDIVVDERAHQYEHSLEVMLPLLLKCQPDLQIVPITLRSLDLAECLQLGTDIANVLKRQDDEILLLASSDMNHFLDAVTTRQLDFKAISAMTAFDPQALYRTVHENRISMCGVLPAVVVMQAAKELGASECHLLRYAHSGQINDDNSRVVGYAALSMR